MRALSNVDPTPEQRQILADAGPGFRLIRGAAGSGKTTTALLRLRQLCASRIAQRNRTGSSEPIRALVLTFNRTLRGYIEQLASEQVQFQGSIDLTIDTFSGWAMRMVGQRNVPRDGGDSKVRTLLQRMGILPEDVDYFVDEVRYIAGRFPQGGLHDYVQTVRTGRGRAPAINRQLRNRLLADVLEPYEARKQREAICDWNDVALDAAATKSEGYDIVVADETQDFSANQIRAILAHLKTDHSTTFIMDTMQRIYPQNYQWREVGIDMRRQRVYTLARNYRNTAEIARLAASLVDGLPEEENGLSPNPAACRESGDKPKVVAGLYSSQVAYMLDQIGPLISNGETVAFLQPRGGGYFKHLRQALQRRSISYCELTQMRDWPVGPELVALSTIHSSKGLEFDHVLLPGLNQEVTSHGNEDGDGRQDNLRRLLAMAMGRACRTVTLGYKPGEQSTLIALLDPTAYDFVEV